MRWDAAPRAAPGMQANPPGSFSKKRARMRTESKGDVTDTKAAAGRALAWVWTGMLLAGAGMAGAASVDPFAEFLSSVPAATTTISTENSGSGAQAITTRKFTFPSRKGVNTIYGILSYPQAAGTYPGILQLHGGGSNAETLTGMTVDYAKRGYVALAIDLPGICGTANTPNTTGPWKSRPLGEAPRFEVVPGPEKSTLVDAEVAGLEAFNWLRAQANVKPDAMGITGFSWGGYSTTILSGLLGGKVKAAYAVFGCGFYDKGSAWKTLIEGLSAADRDVWLANLDAGRRAPNIQAAYFLEGETNDTYFWPEAVGATLNAIPGTAKNHVWGPNLNHNQLPDGPAMQRFWFDYHLKGQGSGFSKVTITGSEAMAGKGRKITLTVEPAAGAVISAVRLHYSVTGADWQSRQWDSVTAVAGPQGVYMATLPDSIASRKTDFYAKATDSRKVSTGSDMYNTSQVVTGLRRQQAGPALHSGAQRSLAAITTWIRNPGNGRGPESVDANGKRQETSMLPIDRPRW
jgi:dienelactone hydrolase